MGVSITSAAVGRAIRATREREALSLARVARDSDLTPAQLDEIEVGRARPSIAVFDRIARAIGCTLVDLVVDPRGDATRRLGLMDIALAIVELELPGYGSKIDAVEAATVLVAMCTCRENQSAAARLLRMDRKAFVRRLSHARRSGLKLDLASLAQREE
jgi:transcriptional regulator with XRE-family HTH domain